MDRRLFLIGAGAAPLVFVTDLQAAERAEAGRLLVLIDLIGGNDGANTLVPYREKTYFRARPNIALDARSLLPLSREQALHGSLREIMPLWDAGELALVQGVGCAQGSLSHHRATEILDSASLDDRPFQPGWLARALALHPATRRAGVQALTACPDGSGPFHGLARCRRLDDAEAGASVARFGFPPDALGRALAGACAELASGCDATVVQVALDGFDTHENQLPAHAALLATLARSMASLRNVLAAMGRWCDTVVMTRSEFGRLAHENLSAGTDHGNAGLQLLAGGAIAGGLHGQALNFDQLDSRGGFLPTLDFRAVYSAVSERWLGVRTPPVPASTGGLFRV